MMEFQYKNGAYQLDDQGCLLDPETWTRDFAEAMARECDIPVLSHEHWDVIQYVRDAYKKTGICPTIFATCKATSFRPQEIQKLFPTGYHRGLCRVAGVHYRINHMPYGAHVRESVADLRALSADKVYTTDVRGFLVDPDSWDENFAVHRAMEMPIANNQLTEEHWRIIYYLRDVHQVEHRIPNIFEACESCNIDLDTLERLFPNGYHRGALKMAGLRFIK